MSDENTDLGEATVYLDENGMEFPVLIRLDPKLVALIAENQTLLREKHLSFRLQPSEHRILKVAPLTPARCN